MTWATCGRSQNCTARARSTRMPDRSRGIRARSRKAHQPTPSAKKLEGMEEAAPADSAGMDDGVDVGVEAFADLARFPGVRRGIKRHVNHDGRADDVFARDATPNAAVVGIASVIPHRKVAILRDNMRKLHLGPAQRRFTGISRFGRASRVWLAERLAVDPDGAIAKIDLVAGQSDDAL